MKKNLKAKVLVGVMSLTMVSGATVAFAGTDVGAQLQNWYGIQYSAAETAIGTTLSNYGMSLLPGVTGEKDTLQRNAVDAVATSGTTETNRAVGEIGTYKAGLTTALGVKQTSIKALMPTQFDTLVGDTNGQVQSALDAAARTASTQINGAINTQGTTSLGAVTTDVTAAQNTAVTALTDEISAAKSELQGLITTETTTANTELKTNLDAQIQAKREAITTATASLETAKEDAITAEGQRIEVAAKGDLDGLVAGIFGN